MASTHLDGGRDVILPQTATSVPEIEAFARVAHRHSATFMEFVLLEERPMRSPGSATARTTVWGEHNRELVARLGGSTWLEGIYDQLLRVVASRTSTIVIGSQFGCPKTRTP
jgi:hypothetical protein